MVNCAAPIPVNTTDRVSPSPEPLMPMTSPGEPVTGDSSTGSGAAASTTPLPSESTHPTCATEAGQSDSELFSIRQLTGCGLSTAQLLLGVESGPPTSVPWHRPASSSAPNR